MPTVTWTSAGLYTWTVPNDVTSVNIEVAGAGGGNPTGGAGGLSVGDLAVTPGENLYIYVGGAGGNSSRGYNGGGSSSTTSDGGSGGGGTDVRQGGSTLSARVIIAGGGGGSAYSNAGGAGGGLQGEDGHADQPEYAGEGGTQTSAGSGAGGTGFLGEGGDGISNGGGGGGGYYGGAGGQAYPGGGGSGYIGGVTNGITSVGAGAGTETDGWVEISYTQPPPSITPSSPADGATIHSPEFTALVSDESSGDTLTVEYQVYVL